MPKVKIVVFVPKSHTDVVRKAMGDAGAGEIGNYSHCSYSLDGVSRFLPLEGANPQPSVKLVNLRKSKKSVSSVSVIEIKQKT